MTQISQNEKRDPNTYAILDAAFEVHTKLGCGFLEAVYQEVLAIEFGLRGIPFEREVKLTVLYKEISLDTSYKADFVCFDSVIVETKALAKLTGVEQAQILNYLKATGYEVGLPLNFGAESLEHRRFVFSQSVPSVKSAD